ncbi:hypothetical protein Purlil1_1303 [Purpureocillium lilacinum]|uniref:Uncharacterized protein n=1 Tax=Purpureocillium lilacinum TaxID=33203 RepID=A0ABR0CG24_PURLI|nr:hypothetical protein Purlil1_1303 [Purpureocillium lilacinum]
MELAWVENFGSRGGFSEVSAGRRASWIHGCGTRRTPAPGGRPIAAPPLPNALERLEPATPGQRACPVPEPPAAALREGPAPLAVGRRTARNGRSTALTGLGGGCPLGAIGDRLPRVPCRMEWNNTPTLRPSPSLAHAASHDHPPRSPHGHVSRCACLPACCLPSLASTHASHCPTEQPARPQITNPDSTLPRTLDKMPACAAF